MNLFNQMIYELLGMSVCFSAIEIIEIEIQNSEIRIEEAIYELV